MNIKAKVETQEKIFSYQTTFFGDKSYAVTSSCTVADWLTLNADVVIYIQDDLILSEEHAKQLAGYFARDNVFAVSPKIVRKDNLVQYANIVVNQQGALVYLNQLLHKNNGGYVQRGNRPYNALVINPQCFAVSRKKLAEYIAGFEDCSFSSLIEALCMKAYSSQQVNIYCPYVEVLDTKARPMAASAETASTAERVAILQKFDGCFNPYDCTHNINFDTSDAYYRLGGFR